jgi:hypothetical protein
MISDERMVRVVLIDEITRDLERMENNRDRGIWTYQLSINRFILGDLEGARRDFIEAMKIDPERATGQHAPLRKQLFPDFEKEQPDQ